MINTSMLPGKTRRLPRLNNLFQNHETILFGMETGWDVSGHFATARQRGNSVRTASSAFWEWRRFRRWRVERSQNHLCYRPDSQFWWCPVMSWELSMWQSWTMDRYQHHYQDSRQSQVPLFSLTWVYSLVLAHSCDFVKHQGTGSHHQPIENYYQWFVFLSHDDMITLGSYIQNFWSFPCILLFRSSIRHIFQMS